MLHRIWLGSVVGLLLASCTAPTLPEGRFTCTGDADCPGDFVCVDRLCYSSGMVDLGPRDLGVDATDQDLGNVDLGSADLGSVDLGNVDLGSADLGNVDLGSTDLGSTDLGSADLGSADLGSADLGSADLGGVGVDAGACVCPDDGDICTNELCVGSTCTHPPRCGGGLTCCGGACVNTATDLAHCGGCGLACRLAGPICCAGTCRAGATDPANCGGCGVPCGPAPRFECCSGACQDTNTGGGCLSCYDVCAGDTSPCCMGVCGNTC